MPDGLMRLVLGALLILHGLGHGGAIGALWWVAARPGTDTGGWTAARTWAIPSTANGAATAVAVALWATSMVAFVIAGLGFLGVVVPGEWWAPAAVAGSVVSLIGIVLFAGTWPRFNTVAAAVVNVGALVAVLVLGWSDTPLGA